MSSNQLISVLPVDKKHQDYIFGMNGETETLNRLKWKFGENVAKYEEFFHPFDYHLTDENGDIKYLFEVKTRRITKKQYPTLPFGKNKFDYANKLIDEYKSKDKTPPKVIIMWLLKSQRHKDRQVLYLWELDKNKNDDYKFGKISNVARNQAPKDVVYVKNDKLIRIKNYQSILSA